MKLAVVEAMFPEIKGNPYRTGRGEGSNAKAAISRAFGDAMKQLQTKRRGNKRNGAPHIHTIKATVTIIEKQEPNATMTPCPVVVA